MKKVLTLILVALMLLSIISLAGCGEAQTLKFGMGIQSSVVKNTNADGETNGAGEVAHSIAAVLVDKDGKIVKCTIDVADNTVNYTADGKAVEASEFLTKREKGKDYGMVAYGGAKKEWYEQADAFAELVVGKTADEVKALIAADTKGTEEVINAGCTIYISDIAYAVAKAVEAAAESEATADATLDIGVVTTQSKKDASEEASGENGVATSIVAAALDKDGKVIVSSTDVADVTFTFNTKGESTFDAKTEVKTKKALGDNYGMGKYGTDLNGDGKVLEWDAQGAEFDKALVGKTAAEIEALAATNGYGSDALQNAGCTMNVADMVKAAVKAAKE